MNVLRFQELAKFFINATGLQTCISIGLYAGLQIHVMLMSPEGRFPGLFFF